MSMVYWKMSQAVPNPMPQGMSAYLKSIDLWNHQR